MAAAVQTCVDEAVPKTVNLPGTAWEAGRKGITVFVDGPDRCSPRRCDLPGGSRISPKATRAEYVFDTKHDRYSVAVHVFMIEAAGRILLMRRAGSGFADGQLGLPTGHVDLGEAPTASALREVGEELGIELDPQELRPAGTMFRRSLEPRVDIIRRDHLPRG